MRVKVWCVGAARLDGHLKIAAAFPFRNLFFYGLEALGEAFKNPRLTGFCVAAISRKLTTVYSALYTFLVYLDGSLVLPLSDYGQFQ